MARHDGCQCTPSGVEAPVTVYLAGPIRDCSYKDATDWRVEAERMLAERGVGALSPMRGKEFLRRRKKISDSYPDQPTATDGAIVGRDRSDVRRCDVILAYFLEADKISLGTGVELGWADAWRKPVVAVIEDKNNPHDHPFLRQIAAMRTPTLEEGVDMACSILGVE